MVLFLFSCAVLQKLLLVGVIHNPMHQMQPIKSSYVQVVCYAEKYVPKNHNHEPKYGRRAGINASWLV